jgi:hypothetical protein
LWISQPNELNREINGQIMGSAMQVGLEANPIPSSDLAKPAEDVLDTIDALAVARGVSIQDPAGRLSTFTQLTLITIHVRCKRFRACISRW